MKARWIVLLLVLVSCGLGAGVMWRAELARAGSLADELAGVKAENAKLSRELAAATEKAEAFEAESAQLRAARAIGRGRLALPATVKASPTPAEAQGKPETGGFLAKMFNDPRMRKMMAARQAVALRGLYNDYLKQAQLTPDETERFFQLLGDRQMALMDSSAGMMSGGAMDTKAALAATNASNEEMEKLLGPERFEQYEDFEKTLGDRVQVQQFSQQLGSQGSPLQDYQSKALIRIMSEENANLSGLLSSDGTQGLSTANMDAYAQQVEAMNQRVYNRAISVLSPAQLSAFAAFQKNMATVQVAGLKMTRQMIEGN